VHTYNHRTQEAEERVFQVQTSLSYIGRPVLGSRIGGEMENWVWWYTLVIPVTWEAKAGGL
jgi:hypothetical protein